MTTPPRRIGEKCTFAATGPTVADDGVRGTSYMIRELKSGKAAERHEWEIHFFKKSR